MSVVNFQDLPVGEREAEWDGDRANKRVREWADAEDEPNEKYRRAFVWYDADEQDLFKSYKLQIADVVNGELTVMPRGVITAGNVMQGSRGGVDLPKKDIQGVRNHLAKYYKKMGDEPPWEKEQD
ncbi:MAG: hypothetical protein M3198_00540 [Actinomycetota bacterium]|nr:hypothetical protein [Actinomycetota bacterium]